MEQGNAGHKACQQRVEVASAAQLTAAGAGKGSGQKHRSGGQSPVFRLAVLVAVGKNLGQPAAQSRDGAKRKSVTAAGKPELF